MLSCSADCLSTRSYSGSDIAIVVRDALMQPVRKVISATHFRPIETPTSLKWEPCSPGAEGAVEKTYMDIGSDELHEPPLKMSDFVRAVQGARPTVTSEDVRKHEEWTNDSGELSS